MGRGQLPDRHRARDRGRPHRPQPQQAVDADRWDNSGHGPVADPRDLAQSHLVAGDVTLTVGGALFGSIALFGSTPLFGGRRQPVT